MASLNAVNDLTGPLKMAGDDPKWIDLFRSKGVTSKDSGNLLGLFVQASSRVRQLLMRKGGNQNVAACVAVHLAALFINDFASSVPSHELQELIGLHGGQPAADTAPFVVLLHDVVNVLTAVPSRPDLYDIAFVSANLLLTVLSTQLYQLDEQGLDIGHQFDFGFVHLFDRAEADLQQHLFSRGESGDVSRSSTAQLVRALLLTSLDCAPVPSAAASVESSMTQSMRLFYNKKSGVAASTLQPSGLSGDSSYTTPTSPVYKLASRGRGANGVWLNNTVDLFFGLPWIAWRQLMNYALPWYGGDSAGNVWRSSVDYLYASSSRALESGASVQVGSLMNPDFTAPYSPRRVAGGGVGGQCEDESESVAAPRVLSRDPLADRAASLLLLLLHNQRYSVSASSNCVASKRVSNPYKEVFCLLHGERVTESDSAGLPIVVKQELTMQRTVSDMGEFASTPNGRHRTESRLQRVYVNFSLVIEGLLMALPSEMATLLLYSLLQTHPTFASTLLDSAAAPRVLERLLWGVHAACGGDSKAVAGTVDHLYVLVVCVLMLLQDAAACNALFGDATNAKPATETLADATWYAASPGTHDKVPLSDLCVLCIHRAILHSLFRLRGDRFLLSHCIAILFNIMHHLVNIRPYTAERIVTILVKLSKRVIASCSQTNQHEGADELLSAIGTTINCTTRLIDSALRTSRRLANINLLYALVHQRDAVTSCLNDYEVVALLNKPSSSIAATSGQWGSTAEAAVRVASLLSHFFSMLEKLPSERLATAALTVDSLRECIMESSQNSAGESSLFFAGEQQGGGPLTYFSYAEAEHPETFFLPHIWASTVWHTPEISWHLHRIVVFDVFSKGLLIPDGQKTGSSGEGSGSKKNTQPTSAVGDVV